MFKERKILKTTANVKVLKYTAGQPLLARDVTVTSCDEMPGMLDLDDKALQLHRDTVKESLLENQYIDAEEIDVFVEVIEATEDIHEFEASAEYVKIDGYIEASDVTIKFKTHDEASRFFESFNVKY